ncbi:metalloendopeptidase [Novosphingobium sp. PC22D]|uniref:murein hydrolase activator EnvC family protein n=1 Tax=Novosphingobium sp. PC22D TaxID=1962403 RepID=UPI000BF18653|nr:peptidoglycan DD-metalloendopeptidase family protein [Novosphingobium sp. PC22D]PEQ12090.1 metalloendopeptidase [Novosphingobium sp. PC22D]
MIPARITLISATALAGCAAAVLAQGASAVDGARFGTGTGVEEIQAQLAAARRQGGQARARAEQLEAQARKASEQAERTAREAAALAARIQETEAAASAQEAQARLVAKARAGLSARLAERQRPLVRLTAALQRLSRRPPALALLRPGSVRDTMHMRALLETMLPEVETRTAALRDEIARGRALERRALAAAEALKRTEAELADRRKQLATLESRQRLASRAASGTAAREAERALALAEKAGDLGTLVEEVGRQGELREELARLPGPIMRPPRPQQSRVIEAADFAPAPRGLGAYVLPVGGHVVSGFAEALPNQRRSRGLELESRANAQVIAPAAGRVAFAGPYRGYGRIAIIEHEGGWTSLVTGLARLDVRVGDELVAGAPLGMAGPGSPLVGVELRKDGEPVNPLRYLR